MTVVITCWTTYVHLLVQIFMYNFCSHRVARRDSTKRKSRYFAHKMKDNG